MDKKKNYNRLKSRNKKTKVIPINSFNTSKRYFELENNFYKVTEKVLLNSGKYKIIFDK